MDNFKNELTALLNKYSIENKSNTPDFILATFICGCLTAYSRVVKERDEWYSPIPVPPENRVISESRGSVNHPSSETTK